MKDTILIGRGREITGIPRDQWERELEHAPAAIAERLEFMSDEHHLVRYHVVRELPRTGRPLPAEQIAQQLDLPIERVTEVLDDLERHLFFLVRNQAGAVEWAYPVTAADTGHRLIFSTGERLDAA